jgi:hypothetical protein
MVVVGAGEASHADGGHGDEEETADMASPLREKPLTRRCILSSP